MFPGLGRHNKALAYAYIVLGSKIRFMNIHTDRCGVWTQNMKQVLNYEYFIYPEGII